MERGERSRDGSREEQGVRHAGGRHRPTGRLHGGGAGATPARSPGVHVAPPWRAGGWVGHGAVVAAPGALCWRPTRDDDAAGGGVVWGGGCGGGCLGWKSDAAAPDHGAGSRTYHPGGAAAQAASPNQSQAQAPEPRSSRSRQAPPRGRAQRLGRDRHRRQDRGRAQRKASGGNGGQRPTAQCPVVVLYGAARRQAARPWRAASKIGAVRPRTRASGHCPTRPGLLR